MIYIIAFVLLASMAILVEEKELKPWTRVGEKIIAGASKGYLGQVLKEGIKVKTEKDREARLETYTALLKKLFNDSNMTYVYVGGGSHNWSPLSVHIAPNQLHSARMLLREFLGRWTDKIEPGTCDMDYSTQKHVLHAYYVCEDQAGEFPVRIATKYDLEKLPKGLLKEGCEVRREETVTVQCSVVCAA
jgi:hypothetical protein